MSKLRELKQEQAALMTSADNLIRTSEKNNRDMTAEETALYHSTMAAVKRLGTEIQAVESQNTLLTTMRAGSGMLFGGGGVSNETAHREGRFRGSLALGNNPAERPLTILSVDYQAAFNDWVSSGGTKIDAALYEGSNVAGDRVVYLCPESGMKSLGRRVRNMGLARYIGESLFMTSMNSEKVDLLDLRLREAAKGAVLVIDTAIRFFDGDENSSEDMKAFGDQCQLLVREGARAVILLHHTSKNSDGLTLESGRGSGDFGGFLTCCWGTSLDDYDDAYNSHSLMSCVKQRDFQADNFKLSPSGEESNFFLQYVEGSNNARVQVGRKAKAGKAKAMAFARANLHMTGEELNKALADMDIVYSVSACRNMLREAKASVAPGATLSSA